MGISSSLSFGFGMLGQETEREKILGSQFLTRKMNKKTYTMPFYVMIKKCTKERKRRGKHEFNEIYFAVVWMDPRSDYMPSHICATCVYIWEFGWAATVFFPFSLMYGRWAKRYFFINTRKKILKTSKFSILFFLIGFHCHSFFFLEKAYFNCI